MNEITIATSIAPQANMANQQLAIKSWLDQGFTVIAVNTPDEIEVLEPLFPHVRFCAATHDAREKYGKPYIYFDDLLKSLYEQGSPICGIVNSDIHLSGPGLYDFIRQHAPGSFLFGARVDVDSLDRRHLGELFRGFDYFFFDRAVVPLYPPEEFCIGLEWWDYWVVLIPLARNVPIKRIVSPIAYHIRHTPGNVGCGAWISLGHVFAKYAPPPYPLTEEAMCLYSPTIFEFLNQTATCISLPQGHEPISVIVHTLNEEKNIRNCLESVKWADEIIVVDMYSDDRTLEIAREYTDKILLHERCRYADPARQWAINKALHEWILVVDADELVTFKVKTLLRQIADADSCDVIWLPRANYLFGHLMQASGRGADEDRQCRFFKKSFIRYLPDIHTHPLMFPGARVAHASGEEHALIHFNYIDIEHFIDKLNRYTTIEAESDYASGKRFELEPAWEHILTDIRDIAITKEGLRKDGVFGLAVAVLMAMYHFSSLIKLKLIEEYNNAHPSEVIYQQYQQIADSIIKEYKEK